MAFSFSKNLAHFLFEDINISSSIGVVIVCLVMSMATVLLDFLKLTRVYLDRRLALSVVASHLTDVQQINSTGTSADPLLTLPEATSPTQRLGRRGTAWGHLVLAGLAALVYLLQVLTAYVIMLAVMSYNAWLLLAVTLASCVSYFVLGALRDRFRLNPSVWAGGTSASDTVAPAASTEARSLPPPQLHSDPGEDPDL